MDVGRPRMRFDANVNIVCDGNSLTAGDGGTAYPAQMKLLAPLNNIVTVANCGRNGRTTTGLVFNDAELFHVATKTNIYVVQELSNALANTPSLTGPAACQQMTNHIANVKTLRYWRRVVLLTCEPRQTSAGAAQTLDLNARIDAANAYMRANFKAMGADALVDLRAPGSPFNIPDYAMQTFEDFAASSGLWKANEAGQHVHLNTAGYGIKAQMVAAVLSQLRG